MGRALWLPDLLRQYGVEVIEVAGWRERGSATFNPQVIVAHHTANPNLADMPSLNLLINGRSGLPGPLCQVGLSRSGKAYIVASGRANHAGTGSWRGVSGNTNALGIEAENNGTGEPWPAAQLEAYFRVAGAMCDGTTPMRGAEWVCGHKEWAPSRKIDPKNIDMNWFRDQVAQRRAAKHAGTLGGTVNPTPPPPPPPPPPPAHSHPTPLVKNAPVNGVWRGQVYHPEAGKWFVQASTAWWEIRDIQQHLKNQGHQIAVDGFGGPTTNHHIVTYQRARGLSADGVVGPATWARLHG
jgi:hypothetical protein